MTDTDIKIGNYVIVQRQEFFKIHKMKLNNTITLGKDIIDLDNILGHKYCETFRMVLLPDTKRKYILEQVTEVILEDQLNIEQRGSDNRGILDDGTSQSLTKTDIENFRDQAMSSTDIIEKLIANSKTFNAKTEYSQEKYLKKKRKKYFEYVQLLKPTIRLLAQIYYRQDPSKILGIRMDDLSQILTYSNVQSDGNFLLYDSGSAGLLSASILNAIGADTTGSLVYVHPGNDSQKSALLAMGFPEEQINRCIHVNLYSLLRFYHQNYKNQIEEVDIDGIRNSKKIKLSDEEIKKPLWQINNENACTLLTAKVDSMIVAAKEHPVNIIKELLDFLKGGRTLVVFNSLKEPLLDVYTYLKSRKDFIAVKIFNNFMRNYQILPERTHPEVSMNFGGYILTGYKLNI